MHLFRERARIAAKGLMNSTAEVSGINLFKKNHLSFYINLIRNL